MPAYYIGLMSGTSVDGIDAVIVDFSDEHPVLVTATTRPWPTRLHQAIVALLQTPEALSLTALGELDAELGEAFADAAHQVIETAGLRNDEIVAIGSHGQTLFHAPAGRTPFSLQAGDANRIAERTGITTVADFRRRDIAAGGQGAPLVPAFHQAVFSQPGTGRAIVNIGGIANLTLLPAKQAPVTGFDSGPGNTLMDAWTHKHTRQPFDKDGAWAASGQVAPTLLERLLDTDYFNLPAPKSTGRELFNIDWLEAQITDGLSDLAPCDVQATLCELTARTIAGALQSSDVAITEIYLCGGGAHNSFLIQRLSALLPKHLLATTESLGLHPDWVEAAAFAWLARQTLEGRTGNLPSVTGARRAVVLGAIHPPAATD